MAISIGPQFTVRSYRWTQWKTIRTSKSLVHQYDDDGITYTIWGYDGPEVHMCTIFKGAVPYNIISEGYALATNDSDKSDFETNYLSTANRALDVRNVFGATDSTKIGNIGDRMKVSAEIEGASIAIASAFSSKTRVIVLTSTINLVTGSYTNVYSYSGTGFLHGFNVEFNNIGVIVRLQVDGETIFDGVSIGTLNGLIGTGNDISRRQAGTGIVTSSATLDWSLKQPIKYNSSVVISADAGGGGLLTRSFSQGLVYLSKET